MEGNQKKLLGRIAICALANLVLLGIVNLLGHLCLSRVVIYRNYFSSVFVITLTGTVISVIWCFAYFFLDALKKEPIKNILLTFAFAIVMQFFFSSLAKFIATNPYIVLNGFYQGLFDFVCNALPSILTVLCVFKFFVFNSKDFDESVDALIYGGIVGTGIGLCDAITSIFVFRSVSFDFVLLSFTVRISIFACAAALSGFLLYYFAGKKSILKTAFAYIMIVLVFGVSVIVETRFAKGIFRQQYSRTLFAFLKTSAYCVSVFALIVILIFIQLKKNDFKSVENKIAIPDFAVLALVLVLAIFVRTVPEKNVGFSNQLAENGKNYSFELPFGFDRAIEKNISLIFEKNKNESLRYVNRMINGAEIELKFGVPESDFALDDLKSGGMNSAKTESGKTARFEITRNTVGKQDGRNCYRFVLANNSENVEMRIFMAEKDETYANKIAKTFAKTLEVE